MISKNKTKIPHPSRSREADCNNKKALLTVVKDASKSRQIAAKQTDAIINTED